MAINLTTFDSSTNGTRVFDRYARSASQYVGWVIPGVGRPVSGTRSKGVVRVNGNNIGIECLVVQGNAGGGYIGTGPMGCIAGMTYWTPFYPDDLTNGAELFTVWDDFEVLNIWDVQPFSSGVPICSFRLNSSGYVELRAWPNEAPPNDGGGYWVGFLLGTSSVPIPVQEWHRIQYLWDQDRAACMLDDTIILDVTDARIIAHNSRTGIIDVRFGAYTLSAPGSYRVPAYTSLGGDSNVENQKMCSYYDDVWDNFSDDGVVFDLTPTPDYSTGFPVETFSPYTLNPNTGTIKGLESFTFSKPAWQHTVGVGDNGENGLQSKPQDDYDYQWGDYSQINTTDWNKHYLGGMKFKLGTTNVDEAIFTFGTYSSSANVSLKVDTDGYLRLYDSVTDTSTSKSRTPLKRDVFHGIQLAITIDSPTIALTAYVDGATYVTYTVNRDGDDIFSAEPKWFYCSTLGHTQYSLTDTPTALHSLFLMGTDTAAIDPIPNNFSIAMIRPKTNGLVTNLTPMEGLTSIEVMKTELPLPAYLALPGARYVSAGYTQQAWSGMDLYTMDPFPPAMLIYGVRTTIACRVPGGTMNAITPAYYDGANHIHYPWPGSVGTIYYAGKTEYIQRSLDKNPITNEPWKAADFAMGQFGYRITQQHASGVQEPSGQPTPTPITVDDTQVMGLFIEALILTGEPEGLMPTIYYYDERDGRIYSVVLPPKPTMPKPTVALIPDTQVLELTGTLHADVSATSNWTVLPAGGFVLADWEIDATMGASPVLHIDTTGALTLADYVYYDFGAGTEKDLSGATEISVTVRSAGNEGFVGTPLYLCLGTTAYDDVVLPINVTQAHAVITVTCSLVDVSSAVLASVRYIGFKSATTAQFVMWLKNIRTGKGLTGTGRYKIRDTRVQGWKTPVNTENILPSPESPGPDDDDMIIGTGSNGSEVTITRTSIPAGLAWWEIYRSDEGQTARYHLVGIWPGKERWQPQATQCLSASPSPRAWIVGDTIRPSTLDKGLSGNNQYWYTLKSIDGLATTPKTGDRDHEPPWSLVVGQPVSDGDLTWELKTSADYQNVLVYTDSEPDIADNPMLEEDRVHVPVPPTSIGIYDNRLVLYVTTPSETAKKMYVGSLWLSGRDNHANWHDWGPESWPELETYNLLNDASACRLPVSEAGQVMRMLNLGAWTGAAFTGPLAVLTQGGWLVALQGTVPSLDPQKNGLSLGHRIQGAGASGPYAACRDLNGNLFMVRPNGDVVIVDRNLQAKVVSGPIQRALREAE